MNLAATLFCAVTTLLSVQAITVSVDRADVRPVTLPTNNGESMLINGWRPLTSSYDNIGVNVSPSSQLDRSFAPLHPVLGKLQEHMAVSERLKPQKSQYDFNPPSILGSFAVFSAKQRLEGTDPKTLSTEREYSFLVPPPRDALRFELEPSKKAAALSEPYVRSSQFIPQAIKPDQRTPTYYIKPASFSTAGHPFAQARPFVNQYSVQQPLLPSRQPAKQFESVKTTNEKPYYQQQSTGEIPNKASGNEQSYDRFQQHQVSPQVINGNFYNQINHPAHYKQSNFERDPGFLVHESHEISYVTPSTFKFRPSYHFDNTVPQEATSRPESNKFAAAQQQQQQSGSNSANAQRPEGFKQDKGQRANTFYITDFQKTRYTSDINEVLPKANQPVKFNQATATPSPYVPKVVYVRPELQQQQQYQSSIIPLNINQRPPDVEYETPESVSLKHFNEQQFLLQQQLIQQDRQRLREQEKRRQQELQRQQQEELLKRQQEIKLLEQKQKEKQRLEQQRLEQQRHEQQQQQRLEQQQQQQRLEQQQQQRLEQQQQQQRHEQQQQQRLEQQQQQRLEQKQQQRHEQQQQQLLEQQQQQRLEQKQQQRLEQQQKQRLEQQRLEQQRLEQQRQQLQTTQPDIVKEVPQVHYSQPYPLEEDRVPIEQYKYVHHQQPPQVPSEAPFHPSKEVTPFKQVTVQKFEEVVTPAGAQPTTQEDFQPVIRPYRPQKPIRDQYRRRKPTTIAYETVPTEAPTFTNPQTLEDLTDVPIQTTSQPEITTLPVTERIIRTRRPGAHLRRRRPSTTTTTPEPSVSSQEYEEELVKYNTPENQDFEKKKRPRPTSQENTYDKRPLRKRPNQSAKVYNKEHGDFDTAPKRVTTTEQPFREISATDNYPEPFLKELYSSEYIPTSEKTVVVDNHREVSTETIPIEFYETTVASNLEYYEPTHENRQEQYTQQNEHESSLEHLFTRTEVNYIETTTAPSPSIYLTTQTTTTTSTETPTTTTKATIAVPKLTQRTRVRYGNATRPRFSIKDYKSRMEYKNRLAAQSTSTEPSTVTVGAKIRGHKNQQAPADPNFKEPAGRYKYMTRSSYRTTSSTTPTSQPAEDNSITTERAHRFTPKKRINTSHYYRSRVTTSMTPSKHDQEHSAAQSTARPENVFSSAIRKRPTLKSRLPGKPVATEMQSAAETGSFATTTLPATEAANEIEAPKLVESEKPQVDLSDVTMDESDDKANVEVQQQPQTPALLTTEATTPPSPVADSTTPFDLRHEEELFAKASQSVADLTSSASALYDKPGMFKAVSPPGENRVISAHLKISTDEPTLPIEAFFQEFAKKN